MPWMFHNTQPFAKKYTHIQISLLFEYLLPFWATQRKLPQKFFQIQFLESNKIEGTPILMLAMVKR